MPEREPTIAQAIWPTLRSNSPEAKAKERDQALWDAINERNRQVLRQGLREFRERMKERG
jgi:hypothetical protein